MYNSRKSNCVLDHRATTTTTTTTATTTTTPIPHSTSAPRSQHKQHQQLQSQQFSIVYPASGLARPAIPMSNTSHATIHSPTVISRQHTVSRPEPEPSLKSKPSVSDLIGRLTTPTISSKHKMRSPARSTSGGSPSVRSPRLNSPGKRSVSQNDVIISRPIPIPKQINPTGRSFSGRSPEVQLASRRKAPSPPQLDTKVANAKPRAPYGQSETGTRNISNASTDSVNSNRNYSTPIMDTPEQFESPEPPYLKSGTETPIRSLNSTPTGSPIEKRGERTRTIPKNASRSTSSTGKSTTPTSNAPTQLKQQRNFSDSASSVRSGPASPVPNSPAPVSPAPISPDPTPPKLMPLNKSTNASTNANTKSGYSKARQIDMNASSYFGHQRRLSAPAPAANMTTPRAMSQASSLKGKVISPPVSPSNDLSNTSSTSSASNTSNTSNTSNSSRSTNSNDEGKKVPLNSGTNPPKNGNKEFYRRLDAAGSSSDTIKAASINSSKTSLASPDDIVQLKEQNKKLKTTNKLLKSRLEELMSNHDQTSADLAISEASRNSLAQQVKGYESVQRDMEKKLEIYRRELSRASRKEGSLRTQVQELKISLEEKNIENYTLSRQQRKM